MGISAGQKRGRDEQTPPKLQKVFRRSVPSSSPKSPQYQQRHATFSPRHRLHSSSTRPSKLTAAQKAFMAKRAELPIYSHTSDIRHALHANDVLLLVGETGSGKSTQVPQYIMSETWCKKAIAVTQPRRVAATTLARRVAEETGTSLGGLVGYAVRFDQNYSDQTKIKYLTEGTLLQEMLRDHYLTQYDCVIIDEVHERSTDCDVLLGLVRNIITDPASKAKRGGSALKVVVMSATANVEELFAYFQDGFGERPKKKRKVADQSEAAAPAANPARPDAQLENGLPTEEEEDTVQAQDKKGKKRAVKGSMSDKLLESIDGALKNADRRLTNGTSKHHSRKHHDDEIEHHDILEPESEHIATQYVEGRQYPVETIYLEGTSDEYVDAALKALLDMHKKEPLPGDILVFMTGQEDVESLISLIEDHIPKLPKDVPNLEPLPLFAALPRKAQQAVFQPARRNARKVIVATNIAETSLTISGVRYVVDSGRAKIKEFKPELLLETLLTRTISRASAIQRQGRAGREGPGKCIRLYTEAQFRKMQPATVPEILRTDLASVVLAIKARGVADAQAFPLLTPPEESKIKDALTRLVRLGAIDDDGKLTRAGKQMSRLPVNPTHAKTIVAAAEMDRHDVGDKDDRHPQPAPERDPSDSMALLAIDTIATQQTDEPIMLPFNAAEVEAATDANPDSEAPPGSKHQQAAGLADKIALQQALHRREGDHLTHHAIASAYAAVPPASRSAWASARHLSARALRTVLDVRTQLRDAAVRARLLARSTVDAAHARDAAGEPGPTVDAARAERLAGALVAGAPERVGMLDDGGGGAGSGGAGAVRRRRVWNAYGAAEVDVHPGSVLWGRRDVQAVVFGELVYTRRAYARRVSAVSAETLRRVAAGEAL